MIDVQDDHANDAQVEAVEPATESGGGCDMAQETSGFGEIGADANCVSGVKLAVFVSGMLAAIVAAPSGGGQCTTKQCRADPSVDRYALPWF